MYLHFFDSKKVCGFHFESEDSEAIVRELDDSFYKGLHLVDVSGFNEVELISCLLETLVHDLKIDRSFKIYLVNLLHDTKKSLITSETKLGKAYDEIENLKGKLHELQEAKK